jgi:hypothetical protein
VPWGVVVRPLNFTVSPMKSLALSVMLIASGTALSADTVVIGRLTDNKPMEYVPDECPKGYICLRSWWKSVINVQRIIHGPRLSGVVAAANMQHTSLNPRYKNSVRLFVLRPITDPAERAKLRVDYFLEEMALPAQMYCLSQDPKKYGLEVQETYVTGVDEKTYCFELPSG